MGFTGNIARVLGIVSIFGLAALLVGCGGGDITIDAPNNATTTSTTNITNTTADEEDTNPCASYEDPDTGDLRQGTLRGANCEYFSEFVGARNPLMTDLTIPTLDGDGVHIFWDTLQVGEDVDSGAISDGPTLTIEAGTTLVWESSDDYLLVNRGAKIIADGSVGAPITLTAYDDAVLGVADPFATQLWGGVVINGRGITNKCDDDQRSNDSCHIQSEGKPSHYGGDDNADDSGILRYVVIKHPGAEAAPGDELNGLTLNAVGSGTTIEYVQVYSTYDDGVEFFGGAVEVRNLVALYVRDDSIDYADGWVGSVTNALVIHQEGNGNRCIEADNQGSAFDAVPLTNAQVSHLTCIMSGSDESTGGTHGDSEGVLLRRGVATQLSDSIIYDGYARTNLVQNGNECLELDDTETRELAQDGTSSIKSTIIACQEATKDSLPNGDTVRDWVTDSATYTNNTNNKVIDGSDDARLSILGGSKGFFTLSEFVDDEGNAFSITSTDGSAIGAVTEDDDWTSGWTICLVPKRRDACGLWFLD